MRRLAALLALVLALAGCAVTPGGGTARLRCKQAVTAPKLVYQEPGFVYIRAEITTLCDADVVMTLYDLTVRLEEQHGAEWSVADPGVVYTGDIVDPEQTCYAVPNHGRPVICTLHYNECHPGVYRTAGKYSWVSDADRGTDVPIEPTVATLTVRPEDCG